MSPLKDILRKRRSALVARKRKKREPESYVLHGFPVLPSRGGRVVTHEEIQRLLDEEDLELIAHIKRRST